mmetsp:Transcript_50719/g.120576  ORF Transcript_50719/g.120576 Transcript_50719/m.120576 type:complete len:87 (+) Transcript_50719:618-878(+)
MDLQGMQMRILPFAAGVRTAMLTMEERIAGGIRSTQETVAAQQGAVGFATVVGPPVAMTTIHMSTRNAAESTPGVAATVTAAVLAR